MQAPRPLLSLLIITLIYNRLQGDSWQPDHDLSCDFQYDENINAGYVQLDAKFSSISLEAGLRLENTRIEGEQSGNAYQRDSSFTNHYTHLFPTLSVQYALRNGNSLSLTYGKRIVRPNYRDLNPFVYIHVSIRMIKVTPYYARNYPIIWNWPIYMAIYSGWGLLSIIRRM